MQLNEYFSSRYLDVWGDHYALKCIGFLARRGFVSGHSSETYAYGSVYRLFFLLFKLDVTANGETK